MESEELKQRLTALFAEEAQERARILERDLLSLENTEAADRLELFKALFREAHSLKGAAGLIEIRSIESACHWMEELFGAARDGRLGLHRAAIELLLAVTDAIGDTGRRLSHGEPEAGQLAELVPQLASMASNTHSAISTPAEGKDEPWDSSSKKTGQRGADTGDASDGHLSSQAYVRVPAENLDNLLSQSGELLAARHRSRVRTDQITALQELTRGRRVKQMILSEAALGVKMAMPAFSSNLELQQSTPHSGPLRMRDLSEGSDLLLRMRDGLKQLGTDIADDYRALDKAATALDGHLRRARMHPFSRACEGLDRIIRDLGQSSGKSARLVIEGGDVELDRSILERLRDVLRHLVRNAIDHGLEAVVERRAAGKADVGQITIAACLLGDRVQVSVADDGSGLNIESIREKIRNSGLADPDDEREILRTVFLPSFSTSAKVTQVSGRGVGLDVVKTTVEDMRGAVDVTHLPGQGATFTLMLPLTLTTVRALLLSTNGQIFSIDTTSVKRLIRCSKEDVHSIEGKPAVLSSNGPIAILELADWLGFPARANRPSTGKFPAIVLNVPGREIAIVVEEVLAEQDLVVRSLGRRLSGIRRYTGGTILSDGRVALMLNAATLAESAIEQRPRRELAFGLEDTQPIARKRVLIADDSITVRALQKSILEAAGFEVAVASDGAEAWQILQRQGADVVVSDIEMPRMDGFSLTESIRGSDRFTDLPIVLVTARETEEDRARGLQLGANAYLLKSTFDQRQLLGAIAQLV